MEGDYNAKGKKRLLQVLFQLHKALTSKILVCATVEHISLAILVFLVVLGVPLLLIKRILDLRVQVSRVLCRVNKNRAPIGQTVYIIS